MIVQYTEHTEDIVEKNKKTGKNSSNADLQRQSDEELMKICVRLKLIMLN